MIIYRSTNNSGDGCGSSSFQIIQPKEVIGVTKVTTKKAEWYVRLQKLVTLKTKINYKLVSHEEY